MSSLQQQQRSVVGVSVCEVVCVRVVRIPAELKAEVHHDLAQGHTPGCAELNATALNLRQIRQGKA